MSQVPSVRHMLPIPQSRLLVQGVGEGKSDCEPVGRSDGALEGGLKEEGREVLIMPVIIPLVSSSMGSETNGCDEISKENGCMDEGSNDGDREGDTSCKICSGDFVGDIMGGVTFSSIEG